MNDLWRYRVTTNDWTWLSGDSSGVAYQSCPKGVPSDSVPCGRDGAVISFDSTNSEIWLYGGDNGGVVNVGSQNPDSYVHNDIWRYFVSNNTWVWKCCSKTENEKYFGVYGTIGVADASNIPAARVNFVGGYDAIHQELWIFGGERPASA